MTTTDTDIDTTLDHDIGPRGRFILRQSSGEISIRGVEGGTVRVRSLDGRRLEDLFKVETGGAILELRQIEGLGIGLGRKKHGWSEGAELQVEVPHGADVEIDAQSADIDATDLSGNKRFRTASGEVRLARLAGRVEVETVSGEIELDGQAPLDLRLKSVSGDVRVRVPLLRRLDLGTTSGDIRLDAELAGDGPFALRTISGDVTIVGRGGFRVEAQSITGDLSSDLPSRRESSAGRKVLVVGRPGPTLSFRSVSGDFHVAQPRDAAPELDRDAAMPPEPPQPPEPPAPTESPVAASRPAPGAPASPAAVAASAGDASASAIDADAHRMTILRALERGEISVADATAQLSRIDEETR